MERISNEKGMALVIVLMIIVIFSILGLSVMNYALSNSKQIKHTEEDMQLVDLAEMGVVFYHNALIEEANKTLSTAILEGMRVLSENEQPINVESLTNYIMTHVDFENIMPEIPNPIPVDTNNKFQIASLPINKVENHIIQFTIDSYGLGINGSEKVQATIELDIAQLIKFHLDEGALVNCEFKGDIANGCTYTGDIDNYKNDIINVTAFIDGTLVIQNGSKLEIEDSTLYIKENIDFGNHQEIKNSKICYGNKALMQNKPHTLIPDRYSTEMYEGTLYTCMHFGNNDTQLPSSSPELSYEIEKQADSINVDYRYETNE